MAKLRYNQLTNIPQESVDGLTFELKTKASASSAPSEINVDPVSGSDAFSGSEESPKKTIQAAIDSLPILINHPIEIRLAKGIYTETVTFTSHILGANGFIILKPQENASVVLSGDNRLEHCIILDFAQGVCVRDITIQGYTKEAVKVINSAKIDMNRCVMRDNFIALSISNQASTYTLNNCVFLNNKVGVKVFNTSNAEIMDSSFEANNIAVSVESLSNVSLVGAKVASNFLAFQSLSRSNLDVISSTVTENDNVAKVDLSNFSSRNIEKSTLIANNRVGLTALKDSTLDLYNVDLVNNSQVDISTESASTAFLDNCTFRKSSKVFSIAIKKGSQVHILGNTRHKSLAQNLYDPLQSSFVFG